MKESRVLEILQAVCISCHLCINMSQLQLSLGSVRFKVSLGLFELTEEVQGCTCELNLFKLEPKMT